MRWEEWKFSARLAVQDRLIRGPALATLAIVIGMSAFFLWRLLPEGWRSGVLTLHYNVYLGIDDVRSWPWIFVIPGIIVGMTIVDWLFALGLYRHHTLASRTLVMVGFLTSLIWVVGCFFLILVNL